MHEVHDFFQKILARSVLKIISVLFLGLETHTIPGTFPGEYGIRAFNCIVVQKEDLKSRLLLAIHLEICKRFRCLKRIIQILLPHFFIYESHVKIFTSAVIA
jgi:hypothetical protein